MRRKWPNILRTDAKILIGDRSATRDDVILRDAILKLSIEIFFWLTFRI